jgi:hypothetical protein
MKIQFKEQRGRKLWYEQAGYCLMEAEKYI